LSDLQAAAFALNRQVACRKIPSMKRTAFILLLAGFLPGSLLSSQSGAPNKTLEFDHTAVHVRDLQKSAEFYEKVLGLERISDPFKDGRHIWFRIGAHHQLHVVSGATAVTEQDILVHLAFRVASLPEFTARLDKMQVKYRNIKGDGKVSVRADGVRQIYLQDPDGYWIEVNDNGF
jgi:lactoylglutathione lyase